MKEKPESKEERIQRLIKQADEKVFGNVTAVDALEFRRDQYDLTQAEFAEVLQMQRSHYNEFINGIRNLPLRVIRRAIAIGVPVENALSNK